MTDSKELTTPSEPDQAIVQRTFASSFAKSGKNIQRGQVVVLDGRGVPVNPRRIKRLVAALNAAMIVTPIVGASLVAAGAIAAGAALVFAPWGYIAYAKYRGGGTLLAIETLMREGDLDEAQRRFDAVPKLRKRNPQYYCWLAGNLVSHRGEYDAAITWWREALSHASPLGRERLRLSITKALLLLGRTKEARLQMEAIAFPPAADEVLTSMTLARVMFVLLDPETPSSEEGLHAWARHALEYSHTGVELAALGWAFERSGDEDMATFLANEARERMHYRYLATWWPALQQWLDARTPSVSDEDAVDPG